jgi:prophage regulatory protein
MSVSERIPEVEATQKFPKQPHRCHPVSPFGVLTDREVRLRIKPVSYFVGLSRATIYRKIKNGEFPPPIKVGYASRWKAGDVFDWLKAQEAAK